MLLDVTGLITRSQCGGAEGKAAANELLFHIAGKYRDRKLHRFFAAGMSYADRDDIRQAFLIGCYHAIMEARLDLGDPLAFILNKGVWAAADAIRRDCKKQLQQRCPDCQTAGRPNRVRSQYICPHCGSNQVELRQRVIPHTDTIEATGGYQDDRLAVEEFRDQLTGRRRDVLDLIMLGYDRDGCKNYLKEIGLILGISSANANLRLRQIRKAWLQYQT